MSSVGSKVAKNLLPPQRYTNLAEGYRRAVVASLPEPYQKFYSEWMDNEKRAKPVHWIPKEGSWERNPETGEVKPVQNEPIPLKYPNEMHYGIWGGEAVVQGMVKKSKFRSPVPRFWVPTLKKTVVYSEILDKYLSVVVTDTALKLIDEHSGLDDYLLKTPAYDLKSMLALKLKRALLLALLNRNFLTDDPKRQEDLVNKYQQYMIPEEEVEWYGLTIDEARTKFEQLVKDINKPVPLKRKFRLELIQQLSEERSLDDSEKSNQKQTSWASRLNPFNRPK